MIPIIISMTKVLKNCKKTVINSPYQKYQEPLTQIEFAAPVLCSMYIFYMSGAYQAAALSFTFWKRPVFLITSMVHTIRIIPIGRQINQFLIKPASMYATTDTAAAVSAYGS